MQPLSTLWESAPYQNVRGIISKVHGGAFLCNTPTIIKGMKGLVSAFECEMIGCSAEKTGF